MLTIIAKSLVVEGKKEKFLALAKKMVMESRKEEGCQSYNLYEDIKNPNSFIVIEEWKDELSIQLHNKSMHFTEIVPKLAELREGKPQINLYKRIDE